MNNAALDQALDRIPGWMDRDKTEAAMTKGKRRTSNQVCLDNFCENSTREYYARRHSDAWKAGSMELYDNWNDPNKQGKQGFGEVAVAKKYNTQVLTSPNDRKIGSSALGEFVRRGNQGKSPPKRGKKRKVPPELTKALATQATMMQVSGEGEACRSKMIATATALMHKTEWEGKIDPNYLWNLARAEHPAIMNPVMAKAQDDRRVDWLTYKNIQDWTKRAGKFLVDIGMAKDEPGYIRELLYSEQCRLAVC